MYYCPPKITADKSGNLAESFYYLQRVPGLMLVKNLHSEFCAMSNYFSRILGFQNSRQYAGKSAHDVPCKVSNIGHAFIKNDLQIIRTKSESLCMIIGDYSPDRIILLQKTKLIYDQSNNIVGVFAHTKDITNSSTFRRAMDLIGHDYKITGKSTAQTIYTLNQHKLPCSITPRQEECLFLLVRGKSVKEIGWIMNISDRTVEDHIAALRIHLDCATRSQMIEKAMAHDFLSFMSESFL
jgi:DNA-binding CsgD family transcriptional regulator